MIKEFSFIEENKKEKFLFRVAVLQTLILQNSRILPSKRCVAWQVENKRKNSERGREAASGLRLAETN